MEKISAVYKIVNTVTGEFYIGSSKNVMRRWANHKCPSTWKFKPNRLLYKAMQEYGVDKFRFQILAPVMPEYLKQVEQEFIELLKPTYNDRYSKGWNTERVKEFRKKSKRKYNSRLCEYNGETLTLCALIHRFQRAGIEHPTTEARKYLITPKP